MTTLSKYPICHQLFKLNLINHNCNIDYPKCFIRGYFGIMLFYIKYLIAETDGAH